MTYRFGIGEQVKFKEPDNLDEELSGIVIDRWIDQFNRRMYKVKIETQNYSYNQFYREDELTGLWDIHSLRPVCECGAVKTLNPMNHSRWCPLAESENDN